MFAPPFSASSGIALELLGLDGTQGTPAAPGTPGTPWHGSFLEVGCGTGIIAVSAALAGCDRVTALDISEPAVRNTARNAERHGVADRLTVLHSDLFGNVPAGERFDTVYWHSNLVLAPPEYRHKTIHERAYVDPGYRDHRRFLADAPSFLTERGRILLHFSNRGNAARLHEIAAEYGRELRELRSLRVREGEDLVEHVLLEISVAPRP
ncbi:class I SAM-dependent methyltransferase [Streptomyces sp. SP17BM10]|uniref:class I SAM-dependent methyltransferase n=1 Tax=Streptomyces sp. SP17BM10 TaxID=3002530 RepID=UPI002E75C3F0|nr:class I SAM-dependent methyltransferase [Streptomyces sp. SP17BM10]MEE1782377.1 class I SAM-dependent methyltransferase [Streptomyces sp. SP17BM10]